MDTNMPLILHIYLIANAYPCCHGNIYPLLLLGLAFQQSGKQIPMTFSFIPLAYQNYSMNLRVNLIYNMKDQYSHSSLKNLKYLKENFY